MRKPTVTVEQILFILEREMCQENCAPMCLFLSQELWHSIGTDTVLLAKLTPLHVKVKALVNVDVSENSFGFLFPEFDA